MSSKPVFARRGRSLQPGQVSELTIINADGTGRRVLFTADEIIEAPNWTDDGKLIFNAGGQLWRIPADGGGDPVRIDTGSLADLNNDHVLSPDGKSIYVSSDDSHLYVLPIGGGTPRRLSNDHAERHHYYLHGVSPDGTTLVYTGVQHPRRANRWGYVNIWTIPAAGGKDTQLTDSTTPDDGAEYTPDGRWIWFNSEMASPGHAQVFKMRADGSEPTQVTFDERVNWFPHFSRDGQSIVYLSYPEGTQGHPADKAVILRFMRPDGSGTRDIVAFNGGQGTINVNSWAPDNQRFALRSLSDQQLSLIRRRAPVLPTRPCYPRRSSSCCWRAWSSWLGDGAVAQLVGRCRLEVIEGRAGAAFEGIDAAIAQGRASSA